MGTPINPRALLALRAMMAQRGAAGGGVPGQTPPQPGGQGGPGGGPSGNPVTAQINQALAGLRSANPQQILQTLKTMRQVASRLVDVTGTSIPGVSRNLAAMLKLFDNAMKEASTAMATEAAAGPGISNTMAQIPSPSQTQPGNYMGPGTGIMP
jgi:hypothetical protein